MIFYQIHGNTRCLVISISTLVVIIAMACIYIRSMQMAHWTQIQQCWIQMAMACQMLLKLIQPLQIHIAGIQMAMESVILRSSYEEAIQRMQMILLVMQLYQLSSMRTINHLYSAHILQLLLVTRLPTA